MWKITLGNQLHRGTMHILDRAQMLMLLVSDGPQTENLRNLLNFINPSWALILSVGTPWWICISAWFMLLQRAENPRDLYLPCNRPQSISVLGWRKSLLASPLGNSASWDTPQEGGSAHLYPHGFFTSRADLSADRCVYPHLLPNVPFLSLRHQPHVVATHFCQAAYIYLCISHGELFCLQVFSKRPGIFSHCCQIIYFSQRSIINALIPPNYS